MEAPEDILPVLEGKPMSFLKHYMCVFDVDMPQNRPTRDVCEALLREKLESLINNRKNSKSPAKRTQKKSPQKAGLKSGRVVNAEVIVDTSVDRSNDEPKDVPQDVPPPRSPMPVSPIVRKSPSSNQIESPDDSSRIESPDKSAYGSVSYSSSPSYRKSLYSTSPASQQHRQFYWTVSEDKRKRVLRVVGWVLLIVASLLLIIAGLLYVEDNAKARRFCDAGVHGRCRPCPAGARCKNGVAKCISPNEILFEGFCVEDPMFEGRVLIICREVQNMLSQRKWYSTHCTQYGSSELESTMKLNDIKSALLRKKIVTDSDTAVFNESLGRMFCDPDSIFNVSASEHTSDVFDPNTRFGTTSELVMTFSMCNMKIQLKKNWFLLSGTLSIVAFSCFVFILRHVNNNLYKRAKNVAEEVTNILKEASGRNPPFYTENDLREQLNQAVDDSCWNNAILMVRMTPGVERENRDFSGCTQEVYFWDENVAK